MKSPKKLSAGSTKIWAWFLLSGLILGHLVPYLPEYSLQHYDLAKVIWIINHLQTPELFGSDRLTQLITHFSTVTAPIYFYGLVYPLSIILTPQWAIYSVGLTITFGCAYFAGNNGSNRTNLLVSLVVIFLLLHSNVSPLEGNRRSFTAFFLLGMFWMESRENYYGDLLLVALSAGIYPPVGLLMLCYYSLRILQKVYLKTITFPRSILKISGHLFTYLLILSPYLLDVFVFTSTSSISRLSAPIPYDVTGISDFLTTFIGGGNENVLARGALFRDQIHFDFFLILVTLLLLQWTLMKQNFNLKIRYILLVVASFLLWGFAHLVHPLIYHPFKYTRISLLLALAMPMAENLPDMTHYVRKKLSKQPIFRLACILLAFWMMGLWALVVLFPSNFSFLKIGGVVGLELWKFIFVLPVFLASLFVLPSWKSPIVRSFLAIILLLGLLVLPHGFPRIKFNNHSLSDLSGLFNYLQRTPPGTTVAGPPHFYMDFIPAYAKRNVYSSTNSTTIDFVCGRNQKFWNAYLDDSVFKIRNFMIENKIDYLLVDRKTVQNRRAYGVLRCDITVSPAKEPFLDRDFKNPAWRLGRRLYLITPEHLKSK